MASKRDAKQSVPTSGVNWLQKLMEEYHELPPDNWVSAQEVALQLGITRDRARRILAQKNLNSKLFYQRDAQGRMIKQRFYEITK